MGNLEVINIEICEENNMYSHVREKALPRV